MRFFSKAKRGANDGWLAITAAADGLRAARIVRSPGALPAVTISEFRAGACDADALEKFGRDVQAGRAQCATLLAPGQYQIVAVDAPNVPAAELRTAVRWKLKDLIDFPVDDATVDVAPIPASATPGRPATMFAVAARNQYVRACHELYADAKVPLGAIDIPEMAQRNLSALAEPEGRGLAMLSFDDYSGLLTVTHGGELFLARRIEVGLATLQDLSEDTRTAAYDRITLELQRSLDHFDRQFSTVSVARLALAPLGEAGTGLHAYLKSNLYVPVEPLDLSNVLDLSGSPELARPDAQRAFFLTLGAALREGAGAA